MILIIQSVAYWRKANNRGSQLNWLSCRLNSVRVKSSSCVGWWNLITTIRESRAKTKCKTHPARMQKKTNGEWYRVAETRIHQPRDNRAILWSQWSVTILTLSLASSSRRLICYNPVSNSKNIRQHYKQAKLSRHSLSDVADCGTMDTTSCSLYN